MSIHWRSERNELPAEVCMYCDKRDMDYEGADWENETCDCGVWFCEHKYECGVAGVDWKEFLNTILKEKKEND